MMRIHDKEPVLRTLFQIRTPKPGTKSESAKPGGIPPVIGWDSQQGVRILDESVVTVILYSDEMLSEFLRDLPAYVIKVREREEFGYISIVDRDGEEDDSYTVINPSFSGTKIMVEVNPLFSMRWVLRDLYARFQEIADEFAVAAQLDVNFDESFCWLGGQLHNMLV